MQTRFDRRDNHFGAIRMALALLVIASHSYPIGTGSIVNEPLFVLSHGQTHGGELAVDLFFIISGFLITASYERSASLWLYLKKRILRIYPAFIAAMLVSALIFLPAGGGHLEGASHRSSALHFVMQTAHLREFQYTSVFPHNPTPGVLNGSTWSIAFEFWCYLGVALLGITGLLRSTRFLIVLFVLAIAMGVLFSFQPFTALFFRHYWNPLTVLLDSVFGYAPLWARLLPMYLSGVVFYRLRSHLQVKPRWIAVASLGLLAASQIPHGWPLLFPLVGPYLILALAFHPTRGLYDWTGKNDLSYGTYLYAYPVAQLIVQHIGHPITPWTLFALSVPLTLCFAAASWFLIERHFLPRQESR